MEESCDSGEMSSGGGDKPESSLVDDFGSMAGRKLSNVAEKTFIGCSPRMLAYLRTATNKSAQSTTQNIVTASMWKKSLTHFSQHDLAGCLKARRLRRLLGSCSRSISASTSTRGRGRGMLPVAYIIIASRRAVGLRLAEKGPRLATGKV